MVAIPDRHSFRAALAGTIIARDHITKVGDTVLSAGVLEVVILVCPDTGSASVDAIAITFGCDVDEDDWDGWVDIG